MATYEQIFVDSNYFIAFFNIDDVHHHEAFSLSKELQRAKTTFVISNLIFLEVVTVLSQRVGRRAAIQAGDRLVEDEDTEIIHVDPLLHDETWHVFRQIQAKNVSFVDCSILAVMRAEGIDTLLTFDRKDFKPLTRTFRFRFYR